MIDEKELIAKLEHMVKESKEESGLKEPALLQKIIEEVKDMAVNEEIKARIEREDVRDSGWIPVSERLPKQYVDVVAQWERIDRATDIAYTYYDIMCLDKHGEWCCDRGAPNGVVIAWMPLPEPYRGE